MPTSRPLLARLLPLLLVLLVVATACGDDNGEGGGGGEGRRAAVQTIEGGRLTVCTDMPYAPFEFEEGGQEVGIDVDLVRGLAGRMDLQPVFRDTDFDGIFTALAAGSCDMIASAVSITDERKENNDFSEGYFEINQSLLVRQADASKYPDLESLRGKTIAVQSGTTGADYARENAEGVQLREFTGADEMFTALQAGQVEAILQDRPVNAYNATRRGNLVITRVFEGEKEEYGFVVKKGNDELRAAIDDALQELRDDGSYDRVLETYLGQAGTE